MFRDRFAVPPRRIIPLMAILGVSLVLLSSDLYVPLMPAMARALETSNAMVQLTLSAQFLGNSLFAMIAGPVSDYMGRRFVVVSSLIAFLCCSMGCALATDIHVLIGFRFLQGCAASGITVTSFALVKDVFPPHRSIAMLGRLTMISVISPAAGPILGGHIAAGLGWRAVFYTIVLFAFFVTALHLLWLPETNPKARALRGRRQLRHFSPRKVLRNYQKIYTNMTFLRYALTHSSLFSGKWCFICVAPFVYIESLGIEKDAFGYYLAAIGVVFVIFQAFSGFLTRRIGSVRLMQLGLMSGLGSAFFFLWAAHFHADSAPMISVAIALYFGSIAWVAPPAASLSLAAFDTARGAAASALSNLRMLMNFIGVTVGGLMTTTGFFGVGIFLVMTALIPLILAINEKE